MTTSVCMGTYNGEKYIGEQMMSILNQTKRAEEVIFCDDNSIDGTVGIIRQFIEKNGLGSSWKLYCNDERKGYPDNYYHAMDLCSGDVVFLADQDDVWDEKKLERMCGILEKNVEMKAICCKLGLIDAEGKDIHAFIRPSHNKETGQLRKVNIEDVFYKCEWPGMVMAYRNEWYCQWRDNVQRNGSTIPHDFLISARAAEEAGFWQLDEELAYHRRHDRNAGGEEHHIAKLLSKSRKLMEIRNYLQILSAFDQEEIMQTKEGRLALMKKQNSMRDRYETLQSGSIVRVLINAWKYRGSVRPATVLCDVMIVKRRI